MIALRWMRVRLGLVAVCASSLVTSALAQDGASAGGFPRFMIVTADVAEVHAGADEKYYHFAEVRQGSVVKVVGEKAGWLKVVTVGPAFDTARAYVRYPLDQSSPLKIDVGGKFARAGGRHDVLGINLRYERDPVHSWKPIARLKADQRVRVFDRIETDRNYVRTIGMPETAEGYLNPVTLRQATEAEISRWETAVRTKVSAAAQPQQKPAARPEEDPARPDRADSRTVTPNAADQARADQADGQQTPPVVASDERTVPPVAIDPHRPAVAPDAGAANRGAADAASDGGKAGESDDSAVNRLKTLDAKYEILQKEPIESAEVDPLMSLYREVARENADREDIANYATFRAEQLKLWSQTQRRLAELRAMRKKVDSVGESTQTAMKSIQSVGAYDAVGRLMASTIYDGRGLPRLFRLQDPATGRTIAYLKPSRDLNVSAMLGQVVGVTGAANADPGLNVRILNPSRIDILTPRR